MDSNIIVRKWRGNSHRSSPPHTNAMMTGTSRIGLPSLVLIEKTRDNNEADERHITIMCTTLLCGFDKMQIDKFQSTILSTTWITLSKCAGETARSMWWRNIQQCTVLSLLGCRSRPGQPNSTKTPKQTKKQASKPEASVGMAFCKATYFRKGKGVLWENTLYFHHNAFFIYRVNSDTPTGILSIYTPWLHQCMKDIQMVTGQPLQQWGGVMCGW